MFGVRSIFFKIYNFKTNANNKYDSSQLSSNEDEKEDDNENESTDDDMKKIQ